ncbi:MAG: response regulator [Holophagales bacterium]|jgi:putative two-component system response regulator|nr:response regulator [Holophagales bacterium]
MKKKVMLVDDNTTNLSMGKSALSDTYDVLTVNSGEKALQLLEKVVPDLILLDIEMPVLDGFETIKQIKGDEQLANIPVIFLTAMDGAGSELAGLSLGAVDYIHKPFSIPLLQKRIELHLMLQEQRGRLADQNTRLLEFNQNLQSLVNAKTEKIVRLQDIFIETFAEMVESRDDTTGGHIVRTQLYVRALAEKMVKERIYINAIEEKDIEPIVRSAQLHDVGKIAIPDSILKKPGRLTDHEFEQMKRHTIIGMETISRIASKAEESDFGFLKHAQIMAHSHHERWDGKGYPLGLSGEDIPIQGRLMAIADVYDALVTARPYKAAFEHEMAVGIIIAGKGTQFDPLLGELFETLSVEFNEIAKRVVR